MPTRRIAITRRKQLSSPTPWFIAATVCAVIALAMTVITARFIARSVVTQGTVTALSEVSSDDGHPLYAPEYSFTAADGRLYRRVSRSASNPPAFAVGQAIPVRYDKTNPSSNNVDSFFSLWGFSVLGTLGACIFGSLGVLMRKARRRRMQSAVFPAASS